MKAFLGLKVVLVLLAVALCLVTCARPNRTGSVIFIHPDGSSLNHWNAARIRWVGPDGRLNWDRMPAMAVYLSHMQDSLTATSHGGGTVHAYGVKVPADSFGMAGQAPAVARSGKSLSIMEEAQDAGLAVGIVNSGDLNEPGTGVFLAHVKSRKMSEEIVRQILYSGADVIMGGGERWMLPQGTSGRHGPGLRSDKRNLIKEAEAAGYSVVYNRQDLKALPGRTARLLGVFASHHTFNDDTEEILHEKGLPLYAAEAPTVSEMTEAALRVLSHGGRRFMLMVEEEGSDNFANYNNAKGALEALRRADEAIGVAQRFVARHPRTLLVVAADSDASGMQLLGGYPPRQDPIIMRQDLPPATMNGAPLDGRDGTGSLPFDGQPDAAGVSHPFAICWPTFADTYGAVLVRAMGLNADRVSGTFDNTDVYRIMYLTLFGKDLRAHAKP